MAKLRKKNKALKFDKGAYNYTPTGWKAIGDAEFSTVSLEQFGSAKIEKRHLLYYNDGKNLLKTVDCILFWLEETSGVAIELDWRNKEVGYYQFGCDHDWKEVDKDGTLKTLQCQSCYITKKVDSSD